MTMYITGYRSCLVALVFCALLLGCQPAEVLEVGTGALSGSMPAVSVRNSQALATWHRSGQVRVSSYHGAGWSVPQVIGSGSFPDVAVSSSDGAVVVFGTGSALQVAVRGSSGWFPPQTLDTGTSFGYGVAIEGGGRGSVVWSSSTQVRASIQSGGGWGGTTTLSTSPSSGWPQIATNDSGVIFAAWCSGGKIFGARRVSPGSWEAAVASATDCCQAPVLDTPGPGVSVGVSASGEGVIVGSSVSRVCEKRYVPGTGWLATKVLGTPGSDTTAPQIAVNPSGQAVVGWANSAGFVLQFRAYDPGTGWGPVITGPTVGHGRLGVGIGSGGEGAVVYRFGAGLQAVVYSGGAFGSPTTVTAGSGTAYYLRVGYDASSSVQGVSIWQRAGGGEDIVASRVGL